MTRVLDLQKININSYFVGKEDFQSSIAKGHLGRLIYIAWKLSELHLPFSDMIHRLEWYEIYLPSRKLHQFSIIIVRKELLVNFTDL